MCVLLGSASSLMWCTIINNVIVIAVSKYGPPVLNKTTINFNKETGEWTNKHGRHLKRPTVLGPLHSY